MKNPSDIYFNAQHSPVGAFASFTFGYPGRAGGLGMELGGPANENLFIGMEMRDGQGYETLPFFEGTGNESTRYEIESADRYSYQDKVLLPTNDTEYPGGISFTHDMGTASSGMSTTDPTTAPARSSAAAPRLKSAGTGPNPTTTLCNNWPGHSGRRPPRKRKDQGKRL